MITFDYSVLRPRLRLLNSLDPLLLHRYEYRYRSQLWTSFAYFRISNQDSNDYSYSLLLISRASPFYAFSRSMHLKSPKSELGIF